MVVGGRKETVWVNSFLNCQPPLIHQSSLLFALYDHCSFSDTKSTLQIARKNTVWKLGVPLVYLLALKQ